MKIVTKNIKLEKGDRHYLIYLMDHNNNPIECKEAIGEEDRLDKENELSKQYFNIAKNCNNMMTVFCMMFTNNNVCWYEVQKTL